MTVTKRVNPPSSQVRFDSACFRTSGTNFCCTPCFWIVRQRFYF